MFQKFLSLLEKIFLNKWLRNISIAKKLYFVLGIMALLIAMELFMLFFAIHTLSSVRAYVGAEGLWSKAQKDAIYHLQKFTRTGKEEDYQKYLDFLKVPLGDRIGRIEMAKENPDYGIMRKYFLQGGNHPDDIDGMIKLFRRFHSVSYINNAIAIWTEGDSLMAEFQKVADEIHWVKNKSTIVADTRLEQNLNKIDEFNTKFTILEDKFSATLGEGSRWLENLILKILLIIALTVEFTGIFLTIAISIGISKQTNETIRVVKKIAQGDFKERAIVYSQDEIGQLTNSFNKMTDDLEKSIAEQKQTETTLKESEGKFRALLDSAPDSMVIVGRDGKILMVNIQTEKLFGWAKDEMLGKEVELLIPNRFHHQHPRHRANFFADPKVRGMGIGLELFGKKKNGDEFPVEISLSPLKTNEGVIVSAAIRDITDRKKSEAEIKQKSEELARSNKELEQFAYIASHDLQEPLRIMTSYVQLIEKKYKDKLDADANDYINFTVDAAKRMRILINDLLTYSRVGTQPKFFGEIDCNKLINTVNDFLKVSIKESNAKIFVEQLPKINADWTQMTQLFQNIIANAIKFRGEKNPEIKIAVKEVRATESGALTHWLFSISDNGIGIAKEYLEKIFVIFQRLHSRAEYPGTGIGLAICKKIVEQYGGEIWAESEAGKGTTFYFTIKK